MKIFVNRKETETTAATLAGLAEELNLPEKGVAVAVNNQMIPRAQWSGQALNENMSVVIIRAACGG